MAGGKGTRLHPYSALFPKPLMPLGDMPILELLLRRMQKAGITDVVLAVNHLRHLIEAFFGNGIAARSAHPLQQRGQAARHGRRARQHDGRTRRDIHRLERRPADQHGPGGDGPAAPGYADAMPRSACSSARTRSTSD